MSDSATAQQNLRAIIVRFFPWLTGIVAVASAKGKGLAIRTASGLLHLAGGPDDPAVHRVGDAGVGGSITFQLYGAMSMAGTPNSILITYVAPDGTPQVVTLPGITIPGPDAGPFTINFATKATAGSQKVTCA